MFTTTFEAEAAPAAAPAAPPAAPAAIQKRQRKETKRYEVVVKETKELELSAGKGTALGEIPVTVYYIDKMQGDHDLLKAVHKLCYGGTGKKTMRKRQLRAFNGFPEGTEAANVVQTMSNSKSWKLKCVQEFCQFLDLEHTGDKDELIKQAVDFLMKPHATNNTEVTEDGTPAHRVKQQIKKRVKKRVRNSDVDESSDSDESPAPSPKKKKKEKKKKEKKAKKPKKAKAASAVPPVAKKGTPSKSGKPKSAKFLYIADRKNAAKTEFPDLQGVQLAQQLIGEFNGLSAGEKAKYEARAAAEQAAYEEALAMAAEFDDL